MHATPGGPEGRDRRQRSSTRAPAARRRLYPTPLPAGNWIAVVDGGTAAAQCPYLMRMQVAEAAGAKALVIAHNATGAALRR